MGRLASAGRGARHAARSSSSIGAARERSSAPCAKAQRFLDGSRLAPSTSSVLLTVAPTPAPVSTRRMRHRRSPPHGRARNGSAPPHSPRATLAPDVPFSPALLESLRAALPSTSILTSPAETLVYECDGWVIDRASPDIVVFPQSTEDVAAIVRLCNAHDVPFVPRGAGTGLAGGCLPIGGGVMIDRKSVV